MAVAVVVFGAREEGRVLKSFRFFYRRQGAPLL
jgi:hypothetical protein